MAFIERYVTVAGAGAHDGTSEAAAWTFAEMIAAAPAAGTRVNMKAGSYSEGTTTLPSGSGSQPLIIRGYNSTIGDLDSSHRTDNGELDTTNMPDLTVTGIHTIGAFLILQNLDITGSLSSQLLGGNINDNWTMLCCRIINTQNNAAAYTVQGDNNCRAINCDFSCTGATHAPVVDQDANSIFHNCRFSGVDTDALVTCEGGSFTACLFNGTGSNIGISTVSSTIPITLIGNTFYNLATAVSIHNAAQPAAHIFINNHVTDCANWINCAYSTTTNGIVELHNRTRDVTTLLTNIDSIAFGEITTDTGGVATDFVNAGAGNFTLISTAPGKQAGTPAFTDIGAYQRQETSGSSESAYIFIG